MRLTRIDGEDHDDKDNPFDLGTEGAGTEFTLEPVRREGAAGSDERKKILLTLEQTDDGRWVIMLCPQTRVTVEPVIEERDPIELIPDRPGAMREYPAPRMVGYKVDAMAEPAGARQEFTHVTSADSVIGAVRAAFEQAGIPLPNASAEASYPREDPA